MSLKEELTTIKDEVFIDYYSNNRSNYYHLMTPYRIRLYQIQEMVDFVIDLIEYDLFKMPNKESFYMFYNEKDFIRLIDNSDCYPDIDEIESILVVDFEDFKESFIDTPRDLDSMDSETYYMYINEDFQEFKEYCMEILKANIKSVLREDETVKELMELKEGI